MKPRRSSLIATAAAGLLAAAMLLAPGARAAAPPSEAVLTAAADAVENVDIGGTAWAVDPTTNTVRITADSTVDAAELARLRKATARYGDAVTVERTDGVLRPYVSGGSTVHAGGGWRCTVGFNVRQGSTYYFLTAGHCTDGYPSWTTKAAEGSVYIGPTVASSFPTDDYGIVRYDNPAVPHPSDVRNANGVVTQITQAADPVFGQEACTTNDTMTTVECFPIGGVNATVNYGNGNVVYGMIQTHHCSAPGGSGGPLFSGTTALGLLSGGTSDCSSGGTSYWQPVTEALEAYGLTI